MSNYLLDAGPLIGLLDADDRWHSWSREALGLLNEPLVSTESVIAEACHHLRKFRLALDAIATAIDEGRIVLEPVLSDQAERIRDLLAKYPEMDLGDATLVALSEVYPRAKLVTVDVRDFTIYRRHDGKPVPVIMPSRGRR